MVDSSCPSPEDITLQEFHDALARYDQFIAALSVSKAKPGQKTLAELDRYRYVEAPAMFAPTKSSCTMQLGNVKTLVEWKLKHGKFRPTLMKLVSSNEESFVKDTATSALDLYSKEADASAAIDVLTRLKGIGPATASLLLAVHDPQNVIFFADEAFYWLCNNGKRGPIKYNAKEYKELNENSQKLAKRLSVKAVDVERVAYVLINDAPSRTPPKQPADTPKDTAAAAKTTSSVATKRKQEGIIEASSASRRSKRSKRT